MSVSPSAPATLVRRRTRALVAVSALVASAAVAVVPAAGAAAVSRACSSAAAPSGSPRLTLHNKIVSLGARPHLAGSSAARCAAASPTVHASDPGQGAPPLLFHGGAVMATPANGDQVVVTPIFWAPPGYTFSGSYKSVIEQYLRDVAAASGQNNIFATNTEYSGTNGTVHYHVVAGTPIHAHNPLPPQECTPDPGPVYKDRKHYTGCVDDDQVTAEVTTASAHLPKNLGHMYLLFTPKQLESCIYSDAEAVAAGGNACTVSSSASHSAYCAYHSWATNNTNEIYGEMPFPVYGLRSDAGACAVSSNPDSPNGNVDADVEVSPTSHEMSEAFTDPNAVGPDQLGGWYDAAGFENGDECAYIYGPLSGSAGRHYNQTMNGHHYLTQEEFSNADFFATYGQGGCNQQEPAPVVNSITPASGSHSGGTKVSVVGSYFTPAVQVFIGGIAAKVLARPDAGHMTISTPAHAAGTVSLTVKTIGGTSAPVSYAYH